MKYKKSLSYYQFSPENQYLDRKSARKKPSELLKHLIAFANADGGQLVIGIEDEKQGNIITGFKDARAYPIDEFKKVDREIRDTPLDLSFEEAEPTTTVVLVGEKCRRAMSTLSNGINTDKDIVDDDFFFDNFDKALEKLKSKSV